MCLVTNIKRKFIADKDIKVYKLIVQNTLKSPYTYFQYQYKNLYQTSILEDRNNWNFYSGFDSFYYQSIYARNLDNNPNLLFIKKGFHFFIDINRAKRNKSHDQILVECILPKGTEFYVNSVGLGVSNQIIINKEINKYYKMSLNKLFQVRPDQFKGVVRNLILSRNQDNTWTSKDVKAEVRGLYPHMWIDQKMVSDALKTLETIGFVVVVNDNGIHRTYQRNGSTIGKSKLNPVVLKPRSLGATKSTNVVNGVPTNITNQRDLNKACRNFESTHNGNVPDNVHFSTGRGNYSYLSSLNINHLQNIVNQELAKVGNKIQKLKDNKYYKELLRRNG